jgi:GTP-binding protein
MLIDNITVTLSGGHGGPGKVSFGKMAKSGPDGGNGGKGGNVYLEADSDITLLNQFSAKNYFTASDGQPGGKKRKSGKDGPDFVLKIPVGTNVINKETEDLIYEFGTVGERIMVCSGGLGGRGNYEFKSARHTTPEYAQPGLAGEKKEIIFDLKLIADFGLVGLPNAGKSSLLNELTASKAKTANYPFTTLTPNLGVIEGKIIADIPGLIEGASEGRGLGATFLKHIEKVKVIIHCLSAESEDLLADYKTIRLELHKFNELLSDKPEVILLTKSDLLENSAVTNKIKILKKINKMTYSVSIHDFDKIEKLKKLLIKTSL